MRAMRRLLSFLLVFSTAWVAPLNAAELRPGHWEVDAARSTVSFRVRNAGLLIVKGRFTSFKGTVEAAQPFEKTRVEGTVRMDSVDTGIRKRDDHLRSAAFFDTSKFPEMSFKSTRFFGTPQSFEMDGQLTLKGVTRPVRFHCEQIGDPSASGIAVTATATINRREFGITYNPLIGGAVVITLKIFGSKD